MRVPRRAIVVKRYDRFCSYQRGTRGEWRMGNYVVIRRAARIGLAAIVGAERDPILLVEPPDVPGGCDGSVATRACPDRPAHQAPSATLCVTGQAPSHTYSETHRQ